jgi:hypothetical protein
MQAEAEKTFKELRVGDGTLHFEGGELNEHFVKDKHNHLTKSDLFSQLRQMFSPYSLHPSNQLEFLVNCTQCSEPQRLRVTWTRDPDLVKQEQNTERSAARKRAEFENDFYETLRYVSSELDGMHWFYGSGINDVVAAWVLLKRKETSK